MRVSPSAGFLAAARRGRGNLRVRGTNQGLLFFRGGDWQPSHVIYTWRQVNGVSVADPSRF